LFAANVEGELLGVILGVENGDCVELGKLVG